MTTGSYNKTIDTYRFSKRTWSGGDDPQHKKWNAYTSSREYSIYASTYEAKVQSNRTITPWVPVSFYASGCSPVIRQADLLAALDIPGLSAQVLGKLRDEVINSDFNLGVAFGERKETIEAVLSLTKGTLTGLGHLRRGNVGRAFKSFTRGLSGVTDKVAKRAKIPKTKRERVLGNKQRWENLETKHLESGDVSSLWLAFQYGWLPLMGDIHALMQLVSGDVPSEEPYLSVSKTRSKELPGLQVGQSFGLNGDVVTFFNPPSKAKAKITFHAKLKRKATLLDQLGLTNPLAIGWELVPFSFVIDWFVPIGDYLDNLSLLPLVEQEIWVSTHIQYQCSGSSWYPADRSIVAIAASGNFPATFWYKSGSYDRRLITFDRVLTNPFTWRPSPKQVEKAFALPHLENAAALIHQLTSSLR